MWGALLVLSIVSIGLFPIGDEPYRSQLGVGYVVMAAFLAYQIKVRTHWIAGVAFMIAMINGIYHFLWPHFYWGGFGPATYAGFASLVAGALFHMMAVITPFLIFPLSTRFTHPLLDLSLGELLRISFALAAVVNSGIIVFKTIMGWGPWFMMANPANDAGFIGICLPMILYAPEHQTKPPLRWLAVLLCAIAMLLTDSSTGIMALGLSLGIYFAAVLRIYFLTPLISRLAILAGFCAIIAGIGFLFQGDELTASSGRFGVWEIAMRWWWTKANHWMGTGLGTYFAYGPGLQVEAAYRSGMTEGVIPGFFWAHNDWLQVLFELGWPGLLSVLAVFGLSVKRASKTPWLLSSLLTFGAVAVIQMPLRHFLPSLVGAFLVVTAFSDPDKSPP